jgi:hypothetical protein
MHVWAQEANIQAHIIVLMLKKRVQSCLVLLHLPSC